MRSSSPVTIARSSTLIALVLAQGACDANRRDGEAAVRAYNDALIEAYRTADPAGLEAVAGPDECRRIQVLIDLKESNRIVLESTLESLEVISVEPAESGGLQVETQERWRYRDRPKDPGRPPGDELVAETGLRYDLAFRDGRLKVVEAETLFHRFLELDSDPDETTRGSITTP